MAKIDVLNVLGKTVSEIELADSVFAINPHNQAMFDLVIAERAASRQGTHSTKTRDEVSGGGRKPWKQKGTGRARQGSIRSPQWKGGGIVFGPTPERNYKLKVNRKVKLLALKSGWSQIFSKKQLFVLNDLTFETPSTQDFSQMIKNLKLTNKKILLILGADKKNHYAFLSGRNISKVVTVTPQELLLNHLLKADAIVTDEQTIKAIEGGLN